ncbi:hypothetical protein FACS1894208_02640 [Clostridia bacterium]|nr:hypothetical protein FACS1894208_02640 [Clostridia bacterium]
MPKVIAGTYEITREIGSGGGGVVYLARHLRLDKQVVLKADKRKVTAKPESLRREVDALKNLSHQYIPQVYDFIVEDNIVYTVMDFIEGDSFDKPLKNGERFTQPQVINWACQLLEALVYLHSRPPHGILHADIKPANVMLTPQGDIRLIDFNIALALGEEGAVAVGRSLGYASPEHLGLDFSSSGATTRTSTRSDARATTVLDSPETVFASEPTPQISASSGKKIMLDVRSDVYGLGATLYHILTGKRPAHRVSEVIPLSDKEYSHGLAAIINKAMNPNPDLRFQTADEMLYAFEHLRETDPRVRRWKRTRNIASIVLTLVFLLGGLTTFVGLKQAEAEQRQIAEQERIEAENQRIEADRQRTEAELQEAYALAAKSADALRIGDNDAAIKYALDAMPETGDLNQVCIPEAQKALADALGVYDLSDGFKSHKVLELPSETLKIALSPDGKVAAAITLGKLTVFDTETAEIVVTLQTVDSALADVEFVGESQLVFTGIEGICLYDLTRSKVIWTGKLATEIAVSASGLAFASVYKDEDKATIYDANGRIVNTVSFDGRKQRVAVNDSFANPNDNLLALSADGNWLAVSFSNGALTVFDLNAPDGAIEIYDESEFFHFEGGFSGGFFAFSLTGAESSVFAVIDMQYIAQTGGFEGKNPYGVVANESGIYISSENIVVKIDPISGEQEEVAYTTADVAGFDVSGGDSVIGVKDNSFAFFDENARLTSQYKGSFNADFVSINGDYAIIGSRNTPRIRILKREVYQSLFEYDSGYFHDEARVNADDTAVMLFSFGGFRLFDMNGNLLEEVLLPDAKQIYDQQYRRNEKGSYLEVIYNDGKAELYSGDTGELIGTEQREKPDLSLYEEFFADTLRITSPLHGAPAAYDRESGTLIRELEKDAYLTYVTQVGENVLTEYVSTDGNRYGLLLDGKTCETLAYLPNLCDIIGERLIFDVSSGCLRETHLYTLNELIAQANSKEGGK